MFWIEHFFTWFNIKVWIKFHYIFWFCHDTELSMHTIKRVSLFSIFFVIFISVGSFSCCQREDRNIWLFALRCALCRLKSRRICGAIKRKSEKTRWNGRKLEDLIRRNRAFRPVIQKNVLVLTECPYRGSSRSAAMSAVFV